MKVAFFLASYLNFTGAQRSLGLLARSLPNEIERLAIFPGEGRAADAYRRWGIPTVVMESPQALRQFDKIHLRASRARQAVILGTAVLPYALRLARLFKRARVDIVHCNDARSVLIAGTAARFAGVPVIWHVRGENIVRLHPHMDWAVHLLSDHAILVADSLAAGLRAELPKTTVYNGVIARPPRDRRKPKLSRLMGEERARSFVIVTASSFVPYKGLHHAVDAIATASAMLPKVKLEWLVLGDAQTDEAKCYMREIKERAAEARLTNVTWAGWREDAAELIGEADVLLLPTVQEEVFEYRDGKAVRALCLEGMPRVVLEAMAGGTPVIATDVAGVREAVVHGETGFVVPPSDPRAIASAIQSIAKDKDGAERMRGASHERGQLFSIDSTVTQTVKVYCALLGHRSSLATKRRT